MDHRALFEGVCELLTGSGLVIAAPGRPGLHVGHGPQGVLVGWQETGDGPCAVLEGVLPPQLAGPRTGCGPAGSGERDAVVFALAVVLERAGFRFTADVGGGLLVTAETGAET